MLVIPLPKKSCENGVGIYGAYKYSLPVQLKYLPLPPSNHKTGAPIPTFAPFQHHQSRPSEKQFIFNKSRETRKIDSSFINAPHCLIITRNYHDNGPMPTNFLDLDIFEILYD